MNLNNLILPSYIKYIAYGALAVATFSYGYIKGQSNAFDNQVTTSEKVIIKQGKVTTKIITKYIKVKEEQDKTDEEIKNEGQAYGIKFPSDYYFNNEYVRLHDSSVTGKLSTLSSGDAGQTSGVSVARQLEVAINNNIAGRQWKERAQLCEEWAKEQEELNK